MYSKLEINVIEDIIARLSILINDDEVEYFELSNNMYDLVNFIYEYDLVNFIYKKDNNSGSIYRNAKLSTDWVSEHLRDILDVMEFLKGEMETDFYLATQNLMFDSIEQFQLFITIELATRLLEDYTLIVNENGILNNESLKTLINELEMDINCRRINK